jgi:hypothetical protein
MGASAAQNVEQRRWQLYGVTPVAATAAHCKLGAPG